MLAGGGARFGRLLDEDGVDIIICKPRYPRAEPGSKHPFTDIREPTHTSKNSWHSYNCDVLCTAVPDVRMIRVQQYVQQYSYSNSYSSNGNRQDFDLVAMVHNGWPNTRDTQRKFYGT